MFDYKPPKGLEKEGITIIEAGEEARENHGLGYGAYVYEITDEQIAALQEGKQLAINIGVEYVAFVERGRGDNSARNYFIGMEP